MSITSLQSDRSGDALRTYSVLFFNYIIYERDLVATRSSARFISQHSVLAVVLTSFFSSPEDQKILEEEFRRNSKPDKAARMDIVSKVALGEKEVQVRALTSHLFRFATWTHFFVQIWFQNRRQNSRRKSRPLETYDVISHVHSDGTNTSEPNSHVDDAEEDGEGDFGAENVHGEKQKAENVSEKDVLKVESERKDQAASQDATEGDSQASNKTASSDLPPRSTLPSDPNSSQSFISSQDTSTTGYLANRRSASFIRLRPETQHEAFFGATPAAIPSPTNSQPAQARTLSRSKSFLRLSMTDDGQARIVDRLAQSPSPPRPQSSSLPLPAESRPLRRSFSAAGLNDLFQQGSPEEGTRKFPRVNKAAGRSRDSRTWEFYCDSEARNSSLAEKAEQETSGSARDALGFIRQNSKKTLLLNPRKANTPVRLQDGSTQHKSPTKPGLKRATTTNGRLQQPTKKTVGKKGDESEEWERPSTDSDKENWEPEDGQSQIPHRRAHANLPTGRPGRPVLGENTKVLSQSGSLGVMMAREKKLNGEVIDAEVAAFMGSGTGSSVGEDLDCVQSLLSLSQGNWK
jgi:hypothetical protein